MRTPRTIAIVGASFGGLTVARHLEPYVERADAEVLLIDKKPYHEFHPLLYEVAAGVAARGSAEVCERTLASGVCLNLNAYDRLLRGRAIRFRCAEVTAIDRLTRTLRLRGGDDLRYDALVLAYGAQPAFYGIPGLQEHAIPMKSTMDALRIHRRVFDGIARADPRQPFAIVIGGGGPTGVELACEIGNALRQQVARGKLPTGAYAIALVEAGSRLIQMLPERLHRDALRRLHGVGVHVFLDTCIQRAELGRVALAPRPLRVGEDRSSLLCGFPGAAHTPAADLLVWTGGIQHGPLARDSGFPCDARGRVRVGVDLIVEGEQRVFALGDCAAFLHPRTAQPLPALASVAIREAPVVARNVIACLDDLPLRRYWPRPLPTIVPLGGKYAGFAFGRWTWVGYGPWLLHAFIALQYFCAVMGLVRGARLWWRGARVYAQND